MKLSGGYSVQIMFILTDVFSVLPSSFLCFVLITSSVSSRSIYDDQPNAHKRFMEKLDARIRNHDREIEKMCNFHHQGFVDAITELLKVRTDAEKLMVRGITVKTAGLMTATVKNIKNHNHLCFGQY